MAEDQYYIFVANQPPVGVHKLLPKLGLDEYEPAEVVDLRFTNKPTTLYIGHYNHCLIFAHPHLPFHFFGPSATETEQRFIACFPDTEIAALIENSTVNLFGFSIIQNGQKIRMKDGADHDYFNDVGPLLQEEKDSRAESHLDEEEMEDMRADGMDEEELEQHIHFQADWGVPNRISKRYLGEYLRAIEGSKVKMIKYKKRSSKT